MPGFGAPFSGLANDRKLTDEDLIASQVAAALDTDRAKPSWIVSHELALDEAPEAYKHFDARDNGWTKVILHPAGAQKGSNRQSTQKKAVRKEALNAHERGKSKFK